MVQGQYEWNVIVFCPFPGFNQCGDLCFDVAVCRHDAFGLIGGPTGVYDQCFSIVAQGWQRHAFCCIDVFDILNINAIFFLIAEELKGTKTAMEDLIRIN